MSEGRAALSWRYWNPAIEIVRRSKVVCLVLNLVVALLHCPGCVCGESHSESPSP